MLTELIELGQKMKDTQNEIKQDIQGTNSEGKEAGIQINDLGKKEINKHSTRTERRNKNSKK